MSKINITPDEGYYGLGRVGITVAATDRDITENGVYEGLFRKITVSIDQHESEIAELEEQVANLETEITGLNNTITEKNQQIATLQADVTAKTEQITTLQGEVAELQAEVTTKTEQITTLQAEITTKNEQIATLQAEKETLQEQVTYMSNTEERVFTDNGEYTPSEGKYAMSKVTINVQGGSGKPEQEKDVVINKSGAVELETLNVTDNGTYNGYFNKVTVDVQGAGGDVWEKFDDYFGNIGKLINSQGIIDLRNRDYIINEPYLFAGKDIRSIGNFVGILLPEGFVNANYFLYNGYLTSKVLEYIIQNNNFMYINNSFQTTSVYFGELKEINFKGICGIGSSFYNFEQIEKIVFDNCIELITGDSFNRLSSSKEIKFKSAFPTINNSFNGAQYRVDNLTVYIPYGISPTTAPSCFSQNKIERYGESLTLNENKSGIIQCYNVEYIDIPYDVIFDFVNESDCIPLSGSFEETGVSKHVYVGKNTTGEARSFIQPVDILGVTVNIDILQSTIGDFWSVTKPDEATYGFELNDNGYYESTNKGNDSTYAYARLDFVGYPNLQLECINYAEGGWDYGLISNLDSDLTFDINDSTNVFYSFKSHNSPNPQTVEIQNDGGAHYITIKYRKDGSGASYNDTLQFKVVE